MSILSVTVAMFAAETPQSAKPSPAPPGAQVAAPAVPPAAGQSAASSAGQSAAIAQMLESVAKQAASVAKQNPGTGGFMSVPWSGPSLLPPLPPAEPECDPLPQQILAPLIADAAKLSTLGPEVIRAVMHTESAFRPCAVSARGAAGLMQLMPATAADFKLADVFDPAGNVTAGARYLKQLLDRYSGKLALALAAYNAGPERVTGDAVPDIPETRAYVDRILDEIEKEKKKP